MVNFPELNSLQLLCGPHPYCLIKNGFILGHKIAIVNLIALLRRNRINTKQIFCREVTSSPRNLIETCPERKSAIFTDNDLRNKNLKMAGQENIDVIATKIFAMNEKLDQLIQLAHHLVSAYR